jgi:uncharacterized protein YlxW (UPF0749 family)
MRPRVGFVVATGATLLLAGAAIAAGDRLQVLQLPFLASVMLGYLSATVAMLSSQSFFAAVEWAIDSYHKVERRETQLFESEKQLQRALHEREYLNSQLSASNKELERARAGGQIAARQLPDRPEQREQEIAVRGPLHLPEPGQQDHRLVAGLGKMQLEYHQVTV